MTHSYVPADGLTNPLTNVSLFQKCRCLYDACFAEHDVFPCDRVEESAAVRIESVWTLRQPSWLWIEKDVDHNQKPCFKVWEATGKYRNSGERFAIRVGQDERFRAYQGSFITSEIRNRERASIVISRIALRIERAYDRVNQGLSPYEPCVMDRVFGVKS